jgi:hypothetical protein
MDIDINAIIDAAQHGQWLLFAGLLLTVLAQIARAVVPKLKKIPKRVLPWIIAVVGVLAAGGGVLAGGGGWQAALIAGVTVGIGSLGIYDLAKGASELRFTKGKTEPAPAAPVPEPEPPAEEKAP